MRASPFAVAALVCLAARCLAAQPPLTNPSFERGEKAPTGWRLEGKGAWEKGGRQGVRAVSVTMYSPATR